MAAGLVRGAGYAGAVGLLVAGYAFLRNEKAHHAALEGPIHPPADRRVQVQRTLDVAAKNITKEPKDTTLGELLAAVRPAGLKDRSAPLETTVWRIQAKVVEVIVREDDDVYLVLQDGDRRTVAEAPHPEGCEGSPFAPQIRALRKQLDGELRPSAQPQAVNRRAEITGVGFFGKASSRSNGARLMPALTVRWLD